MTLRVTDATTLDDAEKLRVVRNACREYMTRDTAEIDWLRQTLWWRALDRATMTPLLFWLDDQPVGYGLVRALEGKWWVTGGLVPEARERRLGQQLFEALFARVGGDEIWLEVRASNVRACKLYDRLGFRAVQVVGEVVTMKRAKDYAVTDVPPTPPPPVQQVSTPALLQRTQATLDRLIADGLRPDGPTAPIRRVVAATLHYDHPQRGMLAALHELFDVVECDYFQLQRDGLKPHVIGERLLAQVREHKADLVWLHVQDSNVIEARALQQIRQQHPQVLLAHWTGDCRPFLQPYLASICAATHATFASSVGQLELFRQTGKAPAAYYMQIGLDWEEDVLGLPEWEPPFTVPDVVFCGNYYASSFKDGSAERLGAIKALRKAGVDVGVVGSGWPKDVGVVGVCKVKQQHHVWKRAKVALSINNYNHVERYYSDRQLISMASGTPVVCHYVPGLEQEFDNGEHCLWFSEPEEAVRLVQQLLADPERRARIGQAGRARVMERHTWRNRFQDALPLWERLRGKLVHGG